MLILFLQILYQILDCNRNKRIRYINYFVNLVYTLTTMFLDTISLFENLADRKKKAATSKEDSDNCTACPSCRDDGICSSSVMFCLLLSLGAHLLCQGWLRYLRLTLFKS